MRFTEEKVDLRVRCKLERSPGVTTMKLVVLEIREPCRPRATPVKYKVSFLPSQAPLLLHNPFVLDIIGVVRHRGFDLGFKQSLIDQINIKLILENCKAVDRSKRKAVAI